MLSLFFIACGKNDDDLLCFSFDIRQCQTDLFANEISENDEIGLRESKMHAWLKSNDIDVENVKLVINFHDAVCEACDVCPQGDRYYIKYNSNGNSSFSDSLKLLNFSEENCGDFF